LTARDEKKDGQKDPPSPRLRGADRGAEGQKKVGKSVEKTEKDGNEKKEDEGDKNVGSNDGPKTISPGDTVKF
jgi:hypothetical protein